MDMSSMKFLSTNTYTASSPEMMVDQLLDIFPEKVTTLAAMSDDHRRAYGYSYPQRPQKDGGELLREIWDKMKIQGAPGIGKSGYCKYYDSETRRRCAVGLLMENEYNPRMEQQRVESLAEQGLLPRRLVPHVGMLLQVQYVHDSLADRCLNTQRMDLFVQKFGVELAGIAFSHGYREVGERIRYEVEVAGRRFARPFNRYEMPPETIKVFAMPALV